MRAFVGFGDRGELRAAPTEHDTSREAIRRTKRARHDLAAAGIAQGDDDGHAADFHSLRVSYISSLARANVPPKVVQALARHSTALLTYDRCVKLGKDDERRAMDVLPCLGTNAHSASARG